MSDKSPFTQDFEKAVLSALVQDTKFLREAVSVIRPEYFIDQLNASAVKVITSTYLRTKHPPSSIGLLSDLVEEYRRTVRPKKGDQENALIVGPSKTLCDEIYKEMGPLEDVKGRFLDFCRGREMETAVLDSYNKLEKGESNPDEVMDTIRRTHQRITGVSQGGSDFFPDIEGLPGELIENRKKCYTTGFPGLDRRMGGGAGAGTLTTFIGGPKAGKSMMLVNNGFKNCMRGLTVVHFSLEIRERKIKIRYASRISGIPMNDMTQRSAEVMEKVVKFWELHKPRLFIKEYQVRTATVDTFRSYLYWIEGNYGLKPNVVIIDYGDLVRTNGKHEQERFAQAQAYEEMRGLASEFDCAIFTASQSNRGAMDKELVQMQDVGEAIQKVQISDHIISICKTEDEDRAGKARLYFAGSREAEAGGIIPIRFNWPTCFMEESVNQQ